MTRLLILAEGQTEGSFLKLVLAPHLAELNVWAEPVIVETSRDLSGRKHRGGGRWKQWEKDLRRLAAQRAGDLRLSCFFDLYGLPSDFPELNQHNKIADTTQRAELLEQAMAQAIGDPRFIPYLQRHEFEALVLAALDQLRELLDKDVDQRGVDTLKRSLGEFSPEDINDNPNTAPSKRILQHIPNYAKVAHGPTATERAGLALLRAKCPRFNVWVKKLEALGETQP